MQRSDEPVFADLIEGLAVTFKAKVSKALLSGYWLGLSDLPIEQVKQACVRALVDCKFMPVPRELRDLAGIMGPEQRAIIAWASVKRAIASVGSYRSVDFDDPTINAVIRSLGGWPRVCGTDSEELDKWTSKEFQRLYRELSGLRLSDDMTRSLKGIFEASGELTEKREPTRVVTGLAPAQEAAIVPLRGGR